MAIYGNTIGAVSTPKTYILETEDQSVRLEGVLVGEETIFDVTPNDVRMGKTYAGGSGVKVGEKEIPSYNTREGYKIILPGEQLELNGKYSGYTKLQALVCLYNTSLDDSVATEYVVIDDGVYAVQSTDSIATISKNNEIINFGIINDSDEPQIIRFMYYKEIY